MEVILLERVAEARPPRRSRKGKGRVMPVTSCCAVARRCAPPRPTRQQFETQRAVLEAKNAERRKGAQDEAKGLDGKSFVIIRQAGELGQLYGSVIAA